MRHPASTVCESSWVLCMTWLKVGGVAIIKLTSRCVHDDAVLVLPVLPVLLTLPTLTVVPLCWR